MTTDDLPFKRFMRGVSAQAAIEWIKTHSYIWLQGPMDYTPSKCFINSRLKTWKQDPDRFSITVQSHHCALEVHTIDNDVLDRICIPHKLWWHGITAIVRHAHNLSDGFLSHATRGYHRTQGPGRTDSGLGGVRILSTYVELCQSNGFVLKFDSLKSAIHFAKMKNYRLSATYGRRTRVLHMEHPMDPEKEY